MTEVCPVCGNESVVATEGSSWRKCWTCEASWNNAHRALVHLCGLCGKVVIGDGEEELDGHPPHQG